MDCPSRWLRPDKARLAPTRQLQPLCFRYHFDRLLQLNRGAELHAPQSRRTASGRAPAPLCYRACDARPTPGIGRSKFRILCPASSGSSCRRERRWAVRDQIEPWSSRRRLHCGRHRIWLAPCAREALWRHEHRAGLVVVQHERPEPRLEDLGREFHRVRPRSVKELLFRVEEREEVLAVMRRGVWP
jgi:hypothetical protein